MGASGTVTKVMVKEQEDLEITGRVETFQNTALLRSGRIQRRVLEKTCGHTDSSEAPWANDDVKNSQGKKK